MQKIEDEEHEPGRVARIRRGLDHAEGGDAVGEDAAQLAVEIGPCGGQSRHGLGDRLGVQSSPVRVSNLTAP